MIADTQLLEEAIKKSGIKISFLCEQLGISRTAFDKKKNGKTKFRVPEIYVLCDLLRLTTDEKAKIFK